MCVGSTDRAKQWQSKFVGCGMSNCQAHTKNCVCSEATFVFCSIKINELIVNCALVKRIATNERLLNFGVHMVHSIEYAFTGVTLRVFVAQFYCFVFASRCAGRNHCAPVCPRIEHNVNFNCGVTSRVEDLAAGNADNAAHKYCLTQFDGIPQGVELLK